ncbi:MAG: magnesium chelatase, partial [Candidatus Roizmanbacteria bacterium]|nr:magnesium chelatase [Candidatus Roizmanbacteria bacterium]
MKEEKLTSNEKSESSLIVRERVCLAHKKQIKRFGYSLTNAEMNSSQIRTICKMSDAASSLLKTA